MPALDKETKGPVKTVGKVATSYKGLSILLQSFLIANVSGKSFSVLSFLYLCIRYLLPLLFLGDVLNKALYLDSDTQRGI